MWRTASSLQSTFLLNEETPKPHVGFHYERCRWTATVECAWADRAVSRAALEKLMTWQYRAHCESQISVKICHIDSPVYLGQYDWKG